MQQFFDNILSKYQCGFLKVYNVQHCLITMIERLRESVDKQYISELPGALPSQSFKKPKKFTLKKIIIFPEMKPCIFWP